MAERQPTGRSAGRSAGAGIIGMLVFSVALVIGALSLIAMGTLVTALLPLLGPFSAIGGLTTAAGAGFLGAIVHNARWRWGYGIGLGLVELAMVGLLFANGTELRSAIGLLVAVVAPTIIGWFAGLYVARRVGRPGQSALSTKIPG